jgi:hypothetical protein
LFYALGVSLLFSPQLWAQQPVQPYIDEMQKEEALGQSEGSRDQSSHIEKLQRKAQKNQVDPEPAGIQPYIDALQSSDKSNKNKADSDQTASGYSETLRQKYGDEDADGQAAGKGMQPHIDAINSGKNLEPKYKGKAMHSAGISVAVVTNLDISSTSAQANSFESVYRTKVKYNPTVDLYYERYLLRDRRYGAFGPHMRFGIVTTKGSGRFTVRNQESDVRFRFVAFPIAAGVVYRAIQPRFIVPYGQAALVGIPFFESRNDDKKTKRGITSSYSMTFGVAVNMDWIGRRNAWERYDEHGILHSSVFVQQQFLRPLAGRVDFSSTTTMMGFGFEY